MSEFLQFAFSGLTVGAIYALVALGFTLIYNASDVINFAQGEFVMLGGMTTVFVVTRRSSAAARGAACRSSSPSCSAVLLYRLAIAPARGASPVTLIIITIGASILLRGVAADCVRQELSQLPARCSAIRRSTSRGAAMLPQSLWFIAGAAVDRRRCSGCFSNRTLLGKSMLATAANPPCGADWSASTRHA